MQEKNTISPFVAILAVVASFLLAFFLGAIIYVLFGYAFAQISVELLLIAVPLGYMLYKRVSVRNYIRLEMKSRTILLGVVLGGFLFLFNVAISNVLLRITGPSEVVEQSNELIAGLSSSSQGLLLAIVALSLAGICEEFTFRGFLQTAINSKYSLRTALFVSSLLFAILLHPDPRAFYTISAFLIGLVLGYFYYHWRSYVVCAAAHATMNLIVLAIILLLV